jgi:hypothetical protein
MVALLAVPAEILAANTPGASDHLAERKVNARRERPRIRKEVRR